MDDLLCCKDEQSILQDILVRYPKISTVENPETTESKNSDFNANRKSETYISAALPGCIKCGICGGIVHVNSTSIDLFERVKVGLVFLKMVK